MEKTMQTEQSFGKKLWKIIFDMSFDSLKNEKLAFPFFMMYNFFCLYENHDSCRKEGQT